ncbi:MAG TPA: heparinase II/III family protein [Gemmatimonadaceae bacterium]|nr:heparinase II/III family protein [Gemmatimonadaceae bacterium]
MILCSKETLAARRDVISGELASLARSLGEDLERYLPAIAVLALPRAKAKLSRHGGRCRRDGDLLEFDPLVSDRHRCPRCGSVYSGEDDYLWWVMGYQLWLAERALHGSILGALTGEGRYLDSTRQILAAVSESYLRYPNRDNVLGPSRPFFSTYLESIWLLQLVLALDFLEASGGEDPQFGSLVRERLIEPSAQIVASYDEGLSNRQVWNDAAMLAAGVLLGQPELVDRALYGQSGLVAHLERGMLADGSWYEGENYHLFAHRGLWYLVTAAAALGKEVPLELLARYEEGFVVPFLTALPDLTFPARRDSQYGVSLRQWRVAESCELGLSRRPGDKRLAAALQRLYDTELPPGDTGRARSTAEVERNVPGVRLTRADLGWKSLLFALPRLPAADDVAPATVLLRGQGYAVVRRANGALYVALDYGHSGGGHGHPDRLNLWLVNGSRRILEDYGTGSYVSPTLPWYRSTLAHNAPLVDGRTQPFSAGHLAAWWDDGDRTWVAAKFSPRRDCKLRRDVVVMERYIVDILRWEAGQATRVDLPIHAQGSLQSGGTEPGWESVSLSGAGSARDGFPFVREARRARHCGNMVLSADGARAFLFPPPEHEWWQLLAPGPPGQAERWFFLVRCRGGAEAIVAVWDWSGSVREAHWERGAVRVVLEGGWEDIHLPGDLVWNVTRRDGKVAEAMSFEAGVLDEWPEVPEPAAVAKEPLLVPTLRRAPRSVGELSGLAAAAGTSVPLYRLGRAHYRRSEETWEEAGRPEAGVALAVAEGRLYVEVTVAKKELRLSSRVLENHLDNEPVEINADGVQLHIMGDRSLDNPPHHVWLMALGEGGEVIIRDILHDGPVPDVGAEWQKIDAGYQLLAWIDLLALGSRDEKRGWLDVLINETVPTRERRRGQLVLSGAAGEWVYIRGPRQDPERYLPICIVGDEA